MNCATVRFGDESIPLLTIPKWATDERCDSCQQDNHLCDTFWENTGITLICRWCLARRLIVNYPKV